MNSTADDKKLDRAKLLIVDDEKGILDVFVHVITHHLPKIRADVVANGQEAIEAFVDLHYAVILMDINMPVLDGSQAFKKIMDYCENAGVEKPSIVFCTGFEPPRDLSRAIADNPSHCILRKPVDNDDLMAALRSRLASA